MGVKNPNPIAKVFEKWREKGKKIVLLSQRVG
jgi:hypothetical protein